jgi:class 3 adenylate cyclase
MLERLFDQLDRLAESLGVHKVETIGDALTTI